MFIRKESGRDWGLTLMSNSDFIHDLKIGIILTIVGICLLNINFINNSIPFLLNLGILLAFCGIIIIEVVMLETYKHKKLGKDSHTIINIRIEF